ncbi:MAG: CvpA family protein [Ignavibacteria bacterium]|nr:CvpA family protein [Ignavibacteria bacterium]
MNNLDLIITLLIAVPAFFGFRKGFLRAVFSLAGFVTGLVLATKYSSELSGYIQFIRADERILTLAAFLSIMIITYSILTYIAGKISDINFLTKTTDRIAGALFGAFKGVIIASLVLIVTTKTFALVSAESVKASKLCGLVINAAPDTYNFIQNFIPGAKNFYEEFEKSVNSIIK